MSRSPPSAYTTPMSSPLSSPQYATPPMFSMNDQTAVIDTLEQRKKILDTCILGAQRVFQNERFLKACLKIFYNKRSTSSNQLPDIVDKIIDIIDNNLDFYILHYNAVSLRKGPNSFEKFFVFFLSKLKDFQNLTQFLKEMAVTNQQYLNSVRNIKEEQCVSCWGEEDEPSNRLIKACQCQVFHQSCLAHYRVLKRVGGKNPDKCDICRTRYTIPRQNITDAQYLHEISNFITDFDAVIFEKIEKWKKIRSIIIDEYLDIMKPFY